MKRAFRLVTLIGFLVSPASCVGTIAQTPANSTPVEKTPPLYIEIDRSSEIYSDGVLSLRIEEPEQDCHHPGETITLDLAFENLSDSPIRVPSRFVVSERRFSSDASILVWLNQGDGTPLLSPSDVILDETWRPVSQSKELEMLDGYSEFAVRITYELPQKVTQNGLPDEIEFVTLSPGIYLLRVIYQNFVASQPGEWTGIVASGRIELCITG